ncbi:hypothetical protein BJX63DRAFT_384110 [Aspergillus granulosus]|uniref:Ketose-bisphosphate aldolase class-II family protein n=1 Tax=Aspergillus granulosus TaxID=176169 RepID=A0ABR4HS91_9EURO
MATYPTLPCDRTLASLPPEYASDALTQITTLLSTSPRRLVVLDDDPTGTQTCHEISVLTVWDIPTLKTEFLSSSRGFFILTNSRALPPTAAESLIRTVCTNVAAAAAETGYKDQIDIVLRGDSTLRGHFPLEVDVAQDVFGVPDAWILAPFFFQGGRYTIDDVHYVLEGKELVPAGQTQFAKDATFGYRSSNLKDYVREKATGRFTDAEIHSVALEDIRVGGPEIVCEKLLRLPRGGVVIVNAAAESDMHVFVAGLMLASAKANKRYIYRTGAAFVSTRLGIRSIPPITSAQLQLPEPRETGGLILAGSYVPKTTAQLAHLTKTRGPEILAVIEMDVNELIASSESAAGLIDRVVKQTEENLKKGLDTLVMTSRGLVTGSDELESLAIGGRVAEALVKVLESLEVRPRFIIAKGGITSSDAATKGLRIKRALIVGQAAAGVPLWRCDEPTSRHRGVPFVVFPGNVGGESTLGDLVAAWS